MEHPPLIVMTAVPAGVRDCEALLRRMRRLTHGSRSRVLLLCDLPDAPAPKTPEDEAILRALQSGVMSMERRAPGRFMLLVRSRVFDDAQRMYLGASRHAAPGRTAAQLLLTGSASVRFDAATISPASLKGFSGSVLLLARGAVCTPDTPSRMHEELLASGSSCVAGRAVIPLRDQEPLLNRLLRAGFSLSPLRAARTAHLQQLHLADPAESPALMLGVGGLQALAAGVLPAACPVAQDCVFLLPRSPSPDALLSGLRREYAAALSPSCTALLPRLEAMLPLLRLILLMISAFEGLPLLAAIAALLPEAGALILPQLLPGALIRLALLPTCAFLSLDALLRRLLARSPFLRIELPVRWAGGRLCAACSPLLFMAALHGNHALAALLSVSLLFAAAPLLLRALASPVRERIPLSGQERSLLQAMAQSAFMRIAEDDTASPRLMLCDCAGCMLGLLEPDEAARRIQARAASMDGDVLSAADAACALAAAQYIRERMGDCDAALRALPAQLEERILRCRLMPDGSPLGRMICAALSQHTAAAQPDPLAALFLPRLPADGGGGLLAPLCAPHAFLQAHPDGVPPAGREPERALILADAALGRPFCALLLRSPAAGPYAPLLLTA